MDDRLKRARAAKLLASSFVAVAREHRRAAGGKGRGRAPDDIVDQIEAALQATMQRAQDTEAEAAN